MNWDMLVDISSKVWVLIFVPIIGWLDKKRREFSSLSQEVATLKVEVTNINTKIDQDRSERDARRKEDLEYRSHTSEKMDKIHDVLMEVRRDTAVNSTKLEERR